MGYRLHHGWALRRLASLPRRLWDGPALLDLKGFGSPDKRTDGVIQQKPSVCRLKIPRDHQTRDVGEAIHDFTFKEGAPADDRFASAWPSKQTDRRTSTTSPLLRRHQGARSWRRAEQLDSTGSKTYLLIAVKNNFIRTKVWKHVLAKLAHSAGRWTDQPATKRIGKKFFIVSLPVLIDL